MTKLNKNNIINVLVVCRMSYVTSTNQHQFTKSDTDTNANDFSAISDRDVFREETPVNQDHETKSIDCVWIIQFYSSSNSSTTSTGMLQ